MPKQIGDYNKNQVLSILRERGPTSRVELSRLMGISPTSITRNTSQLLKKGIIRERGTEQSTMGRKPVSVELCGDFCYVIGADIVGGTLKVALANLMGEIVQYYEEPIHQIKGAQAVMERLVTALRNTISEAGIPQDKIWVTTIGTPGIFDPDTGKSSSSFFLDDWEEIDIRSRVFEALSIETLIDNDVNLDVIGESWKGVGRNYENILYVKLGQGLASRVVLQNKLLRGEHNMAGEIGYMMPGIMKIPGSMMMPGIPPGKAENYELILCNAAISRKYRELTNDDSAETISDLCTLANSGNDAARTVLGELLDQFAIVLMNSATVLDPQVIILGGDAGSFGDNEIALLSQRIEQFFPLVQNIIPSKLDKKACLIGAVKTGLERVEERITEIW